MQFYKENILLKKNHKHKLSIIKSINNKKQIILFYNNKIKISNLKQKNNLYKKYVKNKDLIPIFLKIKNNQ